MNVIRPFIAFSIGGNVEREKPMSRTAAGALCFSLLLLLALPGLSAQTVTFPDRTGSIEVLVEPEDAEILLDNKPVGRGEIEIDGLEPGSYKVTVRLDGHYSETRYLTLGSGEEVELQFVLEPIVGFLDVQVAPGDSRVFIGQEEVEEFPAKLPVGTYVVEARRFGYIPEQKRVVLGESVVTTLSFDLDPAPFELTDLLVSKRRFNPANPGDVGATRISFRVSTYGDGRFIVRRDGQLVYSEELGDRKSVV